MEEDSCSSIISIPQNTIAAIEISDSLESRNCKRRRRDQSADHGSSAAGAPRRLRLKGVVLQQNGHWGAQIYANHQRIWLGTFKSEKEAAMAYNSAAIKLRNNNNAGHNNNPRRYHQERVFQEQFTAEAILSMIRDGSYQPRLSDFVKTQESAGKRVVVHDGRGNHDETTEPRFSLIQLFQKELTPSDVGKLNRLVIPKKFAVKYFPYIYENPEHNGADDMELVFYDKLMKIWRFRYCYWKSSQSFVFTRGWNRFVKANNVKEQDIVTFYTCVSSPDLEEQLQEAQKFAFIDITYNADNINGRCGICPVLDDHEGTEDDYGDEIELNLGRSVVMNKELQRADKGLMKSNDEKVSESGLRLFGVRIN